jgi:hypothetical protein
MPFPARGGDVKKRSTNKLCVRHLGKSGV